MSGLMGLYAQHLGAENVVVWPDGAAYAAAVERTARVLAEADAVVVGIGSGMSSACGYDHYHRIGEFDGGGRFAPFENAHVR